MARLDEMASLGATPQALAEARARAPAALEVWPQNWPAVRLFLAMQTQWRRAGMTGVPTGLDYAALPVAARALRLRLTGDVLRRLQVIEAEALAALAEARA